MIPDRIDIADRPKVVIDRARLGDWEGDTVHGRNEHLVTLVNGHKSFYACTKSVEKDQGTGGILNDQNVE